jgi:hypothetical protein
MGIHTLMPGAASPEPSERGHFPTTRWSLIVSSRQRATANSREALASFCNTYWYPLYAYVRRQGESVEDAQDLTQGFFSRLLEKHYEARYFISNDERLLTKAGEIRQKLHLSIVKPSEFLAAYRVYTDWPASTGALEYSQ